jgi:glutaredoxin 3
VKVVVWSKNACMFCNEAKKLLAEKELAYEERNIEDNYSKQDLLEILPNARTVPQIFIDNAHIGGYTELVEFIKTLE